MTPFRALCRNCACTVSLFAASLLLALVSPSTAVAQGFIPPKQVISLLPGPTIGYGWHDGDTNGLILGAELSVAYANLDEAVWAGFYSDVTYDFGGDSLRVSLGPEVGFSFVGVDAGLMIDDVTSGSPDFSFSVRPLLTAFGFVTIYARFTPDDEFATSFELGVMGKFPVPLTDDS